MPLPLEDRLAIQSVTGVAALLLHVAMSGTRRTYIDFVGEYHDEYVRGEAGWLFQRRRPVELPNI